MNDNGIYFDRRKVFCSSELWIHIVWVSGTSSRHYIGSGFWQLVGRAHKTVRTQSSVGMQLHTLGERVPG